MLIKHLKIRLLVKVMTLATDLNLHLTKRNRQSNSNHRTPFVKPLITMTAPSTARHHPHLLDSQEILDEAARQRRLVTARQDAKSLADQLVKVNAEADRLKHQLRLRESSQDQPPTTEDVEDMEAEVIESPPPSRRSYPRGRGGRGGRGAGLHLLHPPATESRKFSST